MSGWFGKTKTEVSGENTDLMLRQKALRRTLRAQAMLMLLAQAMAAYLLIALPSAGDGAWLTMLALFLPLLLLFGLSLLSERAKLTVASAWPRAALLGLCLMIDAALLTALLCGLLRDVALTTSPSWLIAPLVAVIAGLGAWLGGKSGAARASDLCRFLLPALLIAGVIFSGARLDAGATYPMPTLGEIALPALGASGGVWALALILPPTGNEKKGLPLLGGALALMTMCAVALHGALSVCWHDYAPSLSAAQRLLLPVQGASPALTDGFVAVMVAILLLALMSALSLLRSVLPKAGLIAAAIALGAGVCAALSPAALTVVTAASPYRLALAAAALFLRGKPA